MIGISISKVKDTPCIRPKENIFGIYDIETAERLFKNIADPTAYCFDKSNNLLGISCNLCEAVKLFHNGVSN